MGFEQTPNQTRDPARPGTPADSSLADAGDPSGRSDSLGGGSASGSIVSCTPEHLPAVAVAFLTVFPENPLTQLGGDFIRELLGSLIHGPGGFGLIYRLDGQVAGFIFGVDDSRRYRRFILGPGLSRLVRTGLGSVCVSPQRLLPLARYAIAYVLSSLRTVPVTTVGAAALPPASLVFLGVGPAYRRTGIAGALTDAFLDRLAQRGIQEVKLAVSASNDHAVRFYLARGFRQAGCYPAPMGGSALRLIRDVTAPPFSSAKRASFR